MPGRHQLGDRFPASELCIGDIGLKIESLVYTSKNKTAKPSRSFNNVTKTYQEAPFRYVIDTIYAHQNGNILLNNRVYLRADTELVVVGDKS